MKRIAIVVGVFLLMTGTVWAQSVAPNSAANAKQDADKAKANAEVNRAKAEVDRANAEVNRLRELERVVARQANPALPAITVQPQQLVLPYSVGQNRVTTVFANTRSSDPLASLQVAPGTWWNNAETATAIGLTRDQQKKMDDIFQQNRLKLIDLNASLSKEEAILEPLMAADKLDEPKILTQIDHIAQARAELEKANSRMLLGIRQSLTMEQWTKLQDPANARLRRR